MLALTKSREQIDVLSNIPLENFDTNPKRPNYLWGRIFIYILTH